MFKQIWKAYYKGALNSQFLNVFYTINYNSINNFFNLLYLYIEWNLKLTKISNIDIGNQNNIL